MGKKKWDPAWVLNDYEQIRKLIMEKQNNLIEKDINLSWLVSGKNDDEFFCKHCGGTTN